MYQISFRSISSLMSYHPDNITFPNSKSKRGNNSDGIWWSVTRFELDLPFTFLYICAKFHLDLWILSWVIIRTSSFSSIPSQKGAITLSKFGGVWPDSNLTFLLWLYTYVQNIIWIHQSFQELSSGHCLFSQILSKKGAITLIRFWLSVTRFKLHFPFMVICAKYDLGSGNPFMSYHLDMVIFSKV